MEKVKMQAKDTLKNQDERIIWCEQNLYTNDGKSVRYEIVDNKLIIYGDIIIPDEIGELNVKIDIVFGNVLISNTLANRKGQFKSLRNFPDIVHGFVDISNNKSITSFDGISRQIDKHLKCNACGFTTADGISDYIGGDLIMYNNLLINIDRLTKIKIVGHVDIDFAKIKYKDQAFRQLVNEQKITSYTPA